MEGERRWKSYLLCKGPSLADGTRSLLHPSSAAACSPKWGYWYVSPHAYLQMPSISVPKWLGNGSYEKGSHAYFCLAFVSDITSECSRHGSCSVMCQLLQHQAERVVWLQLLWIIYLPYRKKKPYFVEGPWRAHKEFPNSDSSNANGIYWTCRSFPLCPFLRISMWSGKWAGFSFPSLAELAARQAVASLCWVGHSTAGHGTAGVPARGGCRWGTTCNITSCPQIITARQAGDLQSCSSLHFSISPLKRFKRK